MNCKLEKFWNFSLASLCSKVKSWTVNLKSFEILSREEISELMNNEL